MKSGKGRFSCMLGSLRKQEYDDWEELREEDVHDLICNGSLGVQIWVLFLVVFVGVHIHNC